jgi:hypothetical protein
MKFWTQVKAPAGNWTDSLGSDYIGSCISQAKWQKKNYGTETRVIERADVQVWPAAKKVKS